MSKEQTTDSFQTIKDAIEEKLEYLFQNISEIVDYTQPEVFVTTQFRKSEIVRNGHERAQVSISFLWGFDDRDTYQRFYADGENVAECLEKIQEYMDEFSISLKKGRP